jgi:hypothetical protein
VTRIAEKILYVLLGTAVGNNRLEERDVEDINSKTDLPQIRQEGVNWIDLAQDKDKTRVFANTVMTFGLHNNRRIR